jgi:hypothetical protein
MPQSTDPIMAFGSAGDESLVMPGSMRRTLALTVADGPLAIRSDESHLSPADASIEQLILNLSMSYRRQRLPAQNVHPSPSSDRDPLHDVPSDLPPPPIVDPRGPRVGVAGQVLDVFKRDVLLQEVGHGCHSE